MLDDHRPIRYDDWLNEEDAAPASLACEPALTPEPAGEPVDAIGRRLRHDGWTPERQRIFLTAVAQGETVTDACRRVGLTPASAYALRDRAAGAAFALGWSAANHRARAPLADRLLTRALEGQTEWTIRADGGRVERFRYDNGLATRMLARLDRHAEAEGPSQQHAARLVATEFEAFLDVIEQGEGPARAGLFVAARADADLAQELEPVRALARLDRFARAGGGLPGEIDTTDLDPANRADWTAEQWQRAEAAGMLRLAPEPSSTPVEGQEGQLVTPATRTTSFDEPIWWDDIAEDWRTSFVPPAGFDGDEEGEPGEEDYARELMPDERILAEQIAEHDRAEVDRANADARDHWFAGLAAELKEASDRSGEEIADVQPAHPAQPRSAPQPPDRAREGGLG